MADTPSEQAIQRALAADDPAALELLWQRYSGMLQAYLIGLTGSHTEGEDMLQELFVQIARRRHKLRAARNLQAYLFAMARNLARSFARRPARREQPVAPADLGLVPAPEAATANGAEMAAALARALGGLPPEQRTVVLLKVYRELTFEEIGTALAISPHTAASRYRYALGKLKQWMEGSSR